MGLKKRKNNSLSREMSKSNEINMMLTQETNVEIEETTVADEIFDLDVQDNESVQNVEKKSEKTEKRNIMKFSMNINTDTGDKDTDSEENRYAMADDSSQDTKKPLNRRFPEIDALEVSSDGISILPITIGAYSVRTISNEDDKLLAKRISRISLIKTKDGVLECFVVKTNNSFALLRNNKDKNILEVAWSMSRLDITKKVKAADGRIYIDAIIKDDLSEKSIRIPYSDFLEKRISNLMKYGLSLYGDFGFTMSVYFQRLIEAMPTEDASQKLGVFMNNQTGQYEFNAYNIADGFEKQTNFENWDEYSDALNELIEISPQMQYLISVTMSAPVLTLLKKKYNLDLHSYVVNIVGASSTGKTITQRLCASMWTNPASDKIFSAMLSTSNAALKRLDGRYGIPTIIDEATIIGGVSPTEYAYSVYEEREKRRLNSDCSEKASGTWSTITIMSSEQHFHDNNKVQNGGMAVRVHSLENLEFTKSKEHADKVNNFIKDNYGITGYEFTCMLFEKYADNLEELYKEAKITMQSYVVNSKSNLTPRLVNTYAITYMTAVMLEEMGLAINPDAVAKIMAEHNAMVANEQNLALNVYRAIISYMVRNPLKGGIRKFETEDGTLEKVAIEESLVQEILSKAGFADLKVTIKEMDKAGYLLRQQNGRLKSKLTIDGNLGYTYQFDMSEFSKGFVSDKAKLKLLTKNEEYTYSI